MTDDYDRYLDPKNFEHFDGPPKEEPDCLYCNDLGCQECP